VSAELLSINEAAAQGISRVRRPIWVNRKDHVKIDIIDGAPGPWTHLYCPFNLECNGRDPVDMLCISVDYDAKIFEPYTGPLPDSEEYKSEAQAFIEQGKRLGIPRASVGSQP
jgi:hypothetical protein